MLTYLLCALTNFLSRKIGKAHKNIKVLCVLLSGGNFKVKCDQTKLHQHRSVCPKGNTLYVHYPHRVYSKNRTKIKILICLDMLREVLPHQKGHFLKKRKDFEKQNGRFIQGSKILDRIFRKKIFNIFFGLNFETDFDKIFR